jgi:hypothetical protein
MEGAVSSQMDRLARRLARTEPEIARSTSAPLWSIDDAFEGAARALGAPVSRRRAVTLLGGAVMAGSLLRPSRADAQNCYPGGPKVCSNPKGARVCVSSDLQCCSNDNCAIACPYRWRDCESPANCADTARMCSDPTAPDYDKSRTKFCSQRVPVTNGCVAGGTSLSVRGWCCGATQECGTEFGTCECPPARQCGGDCCTKDQECVRIGLIAGRTCLDKCPKNWHHDGYDCVCDKGRTCGVRCCPEGTICEGSGCVKPREPDKLPSLWDAFGNFGDMANQSAGSHGGGPRAQLRSAQATDPVAAALLALAAVNALGVAAGGAFADNRIDGAYRRRVAAPRPSAPQITSGSGLDPAAARALEKLLAAEAKGFALTLAAGKALARARGATAAHNVGAARKQVLASAGFAAAAARALRPVPSLRKNALAALRSTGAAEVVATPEEVLALQAEVRLSGVPPALRNQLRRLGVRGSDLAPVRAALLAGSSGGPALIGPLADPARTRNLQAITAELARYSKSARRSPISRTRGKPKRFRPRAGQEV